MTSEKVVRNGILHALNTYVLDDGFYDVRVRAIRRDGNYSEAFVRNSRSAQCRSADGYARLQRSGYAAADLTIVVITPQPPTPTPTPASRATSRTVKASTSHATAPSCAAA